MSTIEYIKNSHKRSISERKEYTLFNKTFIYIKDPLPEEVKMTLVVKELEKKLSPSLAYDLDAIYVGQFPELNSREVESVYMNGAIFISNLQNSVEDMCSSIIHEIAHGIEERYSTDIYGDSEVIEEFISKRKKLAKLLGEQNIKVDLRLFLQTEYNEKFDNFLYREVGYSLLNRLATGLFMSPYAATSLREYFANGFESFFCKDQQYLQKLSPKLYSKISNLTLAI